LEASCTDDAKGRRRWGSDNWKLLQRRLATLANAPSLRDMDGVPGRCHALNNDRAGQYAVSLWGPYRLIFTPDHHPLPELPAGGVDLKQITRIVIHEVVNYHGN
jgi:proteic killer suppression protein